MMKFLFYFFLITLFLSTTNTAKAQDKIVYLDKWNRVTDSATATYYLFYTKDSNVYKLKKLTVANDELIFKGYCLSPDSSSMTGKCIFYSNGHKFLEGSYQENKYDGMWTAYYDNTDAICYSARYNEGMPKEFTSYYRNGQIRRKQHFYKNNKTAGKCFDENGKEINYITFRSEPLAIDNPVFYLGKLRNYPDVLQDIKNDTLVPTGQEQDKTMFQNFRGTLDSTNYYRVYTMEGALYKEDEYRIQDSELVMSGFCYTPQSNSKTGHFTFYKHGFILSEGNYENNKQTGKWIYYYDSSKNVWFSMIFDNGMLIQLNSYYKNGKEKRKEFHHEIDGPDGHCFDETGKEMPFTSFTRASAPKYDMDYYLQKNLAYPEKARRKNISGRVIIQFTIDTDGTINDAKIRKGIGGGCDEIALSTIKSMPKWEPMYVDDKKVKVLFTKPIMFTLQ